MSRSPCQAQVPRALEVAADVVAALLDNTAAPEVSAAETDRRLGLSPGSPKDPNMGHVWHLDQELGVFLVDAF